MSFSVGYRPSRKSTEKLLARISEATKFVKSSRVKQQDPLVTNWGTILEKYVRKHWDELSPSDFKLLLSRRDQPEDVLDWLKDTYVDFMIKDLRRNDPTIRQAEEVAKVLKIDPQLMTECRNLGKMRIEIRNRKSLKNIGETLEKMQAYRDRLSAVISSVDDMTAPLLDAYDAAVTYITNLHWVRDRATTDGARKEIAKFILCRCRKKLREIEKLQAVAQRSAKNLDNAYYSIKLAVDASDQRRYQTGFKSY